MKTSYHTGIVLSGGAARGIAHLGVLKALNENGIFPDVLSGTSMGAIVGAFYASGMSPDQILRIFKEHNIYRFIRVSLSQKNIFSTSRLFDKIKNYLKAKTFEDLKIPLYITATNIQEGSQEVFSQGELIPVLQAASAFPILFNPVNLNDRMFLDGGLISNLPVEPLQDKCTNLIGVNVNPIREIGEIKKLSDMIDRVFHLAIWGNVRSNLKKLDFLIEPTALKDYALMQQSKQEEIFEIGYQNTLKMIEQNELQLKNKPKGSLAGRFFGLLN
ncbi:MAG: patatin-like phospholipase family protein [Candidatus Cyclobacteriaceae bacterium M3_2C_046]